MENQQEEVRLKSYSKSELKEMYGISAKTLSAWIKPFKEELNIKSNQRLYTPKQIKIIFDKLGNP